MENMRSYVATLNSSLPLFLGRHFKTFVPGRKKVNYLTGGAGELIVSNVFIPWLHATYWQVICWLASPLGGWWNADWRKISAVPDCRAIPMTSFSVRLQWDNLVKWQDLNSILCFRWVHGTLGSHFRRHKGQWRSTEVHPAFARKFVQT